MKIEFHPDASAELLAAKDWYQERSETAARAFVKEIEVGLERIVANPLTRALYLGETRRLLLKHFPYSIVYLSENDAIQIVAVAHGRRKPGYWKDRL